MKKKKKRTVTAKKLKKKRDSSSGIDSSSSQSSAAASSAQASAATSATASASTAGLPRPGFIFGQAWPGLAAISRARAGRARAGKAAPAKHMVLPAAPPTQPRPQSPPVRVPAVTTPPALDDLVYPPNVKCGYWANGEFRARWTAFVLASMPSATGARDWHLAGTGPSAVAAASISTWLARPLSRRRAG